MTDTEDTSTSRIWTYFLVLILAVALVCLWLMYNHPRGEFFLAALCVGAAAFVIDILIEYFGVSKNLWRYPRTGLSIGGLPLEIPLIFWSAAVITTFWFYAFETNPAAAEVLGPAVWELSIIQIGLIIIGAYFLVQYITKKIYSTVFWSLPFAIVLYFEFPEPWILVLALFPMYLDYFIERSLVKRKSIEYEGYDGELAINIAISYFPLAVLIMGLIALFVHVLS